MSGTAPENWRGEPDTLALPAADSYEGLPGKVQAFFREALRTIEFEWLFKCDDDTYVDLERLPELISDDWDLVGNEFVKTRGSPSGGAGYLLRRTIVELIANDDSIPANGIEDILIGEAAIRHGARPHATERLCWTAARFPAVWNDTITSHWCSPERMAEIEQLRTIVPRMLFVVHTYWRDTLLLFPNGTFKRLSTNCEGVFHEDEASGRINLEWKGWGKEILIPEDSADGQKTYACRRVVPQRVIVELKGGVGNQMFQYAHGLALAEKYKLPLNVAFADYGRPFGLGMFGIKIDPEDGLEEISVEYNGGYQPDETSPTEQALLASGAKSLRIKGYFQNENYFSSAIPEIRKRFHLNKRRWPDTENRNLIAIHVRRGDFAGNENRDVCSWEYYKQSIALMRAMVSQPKFLMISDDPAWCEETFGALDDLVVAPKQSEKEALETMMGCDAFILSNSTFAWWGAWLADKHPVIAPSKYLLHQNWVLAPPTWISYPYAGIPIPADHTYATGTLLP